MNRRRTSIRAPLLAAILLAACSTEPATQLVVVVDTDLEVPDRLDEIRVSVSGPSGTTTTVSESLAEGGDALPLTLGVQPKGDSLGPVEITADGLLAGSRVVTRSARTRLVREQTLTLYLFLPADCVGQECPDDQTCTASGCGPVEVDPGDLPPWTGTPPMRDAGGPPDAGVDADVPDGGAASCELGADCDDGFDCTRDLCDDGTCLHLPNDGDCTDGPGGFCDVANGCQYEECTAETCTAGPCQTAECGADGRCERTSLCAAGEMCCAGACVAAGCDDGNPCTDDACGDTGCDNTNNTASCNDGLFCNGSDTCSGGTCASHAGSPCSGSAVCDEAMDRCTGCLTDADCGDDLVGEWSACSGFSGTCGESGTRTRTVTSFSCADGTCVPSEGTEMGPCSRDTDGLTCGSSSCGEWGTCGGFSTTCDESGTETRSCTIHVCSSGTCQSSTEPDSRPCSRDTDFLRCNDGDTRTCDDRCSGGTCNGEILCPPGCECDRFTCVSIDGMSICAL